MNWRVAAFYPRFFCGQRDRHAASINMEGRERERGRERNFILVASGADTSRPLYKEKSIQFGLRKVQNK